MSTHIFWDNSNIWISAQNCCEIKEPGIPTIALRISFHNLHNLVAKERKVDTKVMSGSVPPECEKLWSYAERLGYDTKLLKKVDSGEGLSEQAVDESLHLAMANTLLDYMDEDSPQTMVLLSGDGRVSTQGTSFPSQLEKALRSGWNSEVYTWENSYNNRVYQELVDTYSDKIQVIFLDAYYNNITYIQKGMYDGISVEMRRAQD